MFNILKLPPPNRLIVRTLASYKLRRLLLRENADRGIHQTRLQSSRLNPWFHGSHYMALHTNVLHSRTLNNLATLFALAKAIQ